MIHQNSNFEDVLLEIISITPRRDLLEVEYNGNDEIWVGSIYLDDNEESDCYDFSWEICKTFYDQSEQTKLTISQIFFIDPITVI